jgi:hypothetical protein
LASKLKAFGEQQQWDNTAPSIEEAVDKLTLARDAKAHYGETQVRAFDAVDNIGKYTDRTVVPNSDATYTESERKAKYPKGMYEIYDAIFKYRDGEGVDRNNYFKKIQKVLPPAKLMQLMNESLLHFGSVPNMSDGLEGFQLMVETGELKAREVRTFFRRVSDRLYNEAKAI